MKAALTGTAFPKPANYETLIFRAEETFFSFISENQFSICFQRPAILFNFTFLGILNMWREFNLTSL